MALCMIILAELRDQDALHTLLAPTEPDLPRPPVLRSQALARQPAELRQDWLQTVLARPLFEPTRRPVSTGTQPGPAAVPALPRLAGVLVSQAGREVIFADSDGKPTILREGASISGFKVLSISAGQVTVQGPNGQLVLRPSFDENRQPSTDTGAFRTPAPFAASSLFGAPPPGGPAPPNATVPPQPPSWSLHVPPAIADLLRGRPNQPRAINAAPGNE
jgi:hypothetical protein